MAKGLGLSIRREESLWDSHSKEESSHKWEPTPKRIAMLLWVGFLQILASPLGVPLPPRLRVFRRLWYYPETSESFRDGFGLFRNHPDYFRNLLGLFWDVLELFG